MAFEELTNKAMAAKYLSEHLNKGTLTLFVGAGVSAAFNLPNWEELVNKMREEVGLSKVNSYNGAFTLQMAADEVKAECESDDKYHGTLKTCLYSNVESLSLDVLNNQLLSAIGALLMSSKRGSIRRVVTLNYDSILEWYLLLNGFIARVVYRLPALEGSEDVTIYHPHGFFPHPSLNLPDSDDVLLGLDSVNKRIGEPGNVWFEATRSLLRTGVCLFIGLSERSFFDRALAPLLSTVGDEIKNERPTGFWLVNDTIPKNNEKAFLRNNLVPIQFTSYKDIPDFLQKICQDANIEGILY